jgi:protein-disulfide isomerase
VLKQYPKEVKLVYKEFPLRNHRFSKSASLAAIAAGKQGKYWQMHDKIFENYSSLSEEKLKGFAKELDLDMSQFEKDRNDFSAKKLIQRDLQNGAAAGVHGTPTIFVNGRRLKQRSLEGFKNIIDSELKKAAGK